VFVVFLLKFVRKCGIVYCGVRCGCRFEACERQSCFRFPPSGVSSDSICKRLVGEVGNAPRAVRSAEA
jgi:hypothetical protein